MNEKQRNVIRDLKVVYDWLVTKNAVQHSLFYGPAARLACGMTQEEPDEIDVLVPSAIVQQYIAFNPYCGYDNDITIEPQTKTLAGVFVDMTLHDSSRQRDICVNLIGDAHFVQSMAGQPDKWFCVTDCFGWTYITDIDNPKDVIGCVPDIWSMLAMSAMRGTDHELKLIQEFHSQRTNKG